MIPERLLSRIAALHPTDRQWLLQNVSAEMRARLIAAIESPSGLLVESAADPDLYDPHDVIAAAAPSAIATVLAHEPAWVVAAVLQIDDWPWRADVLELLPAWQRPVPTLDKPVSALKPAFVSALLEGLAGALPQVAVLSEPVARSPFEDLVRRLRRVRGRSEWRY